MAATGMLPVTTDAAPTALANLTTSTANLTSSLSSTLSAKDAILFPLRLISRADRFLFSTVPRAFVQATGLNVLATRVVESFRAGDAVAAAAGAGAGAGAAALAEGAAVADAAGSSWADVFFETLQAGTNKSYWGMLHYVTSRWAFTCFILALALNRVTVYGSTRQRIMLTWNKRLALRIIPIMLLISQMHQLLQAIHCQTSLDFSLYRHGDNNKYSILDWSTDGGTLHQVTSKILFRSTDEQSCAALGMSRPEPGVRATRGSFALLWPTFLRLSLSHLVENLSCSLQQIPVMTEVGLSVFEHSLAFAEAETMVAHTLNKRVREIANATTTTTNTTTSAVPSVTPAGTIPASGTILAITDAIQSFTGPHPFDRINVPIEVLLVALLSCGNCLTSHIIAVLNKKNKWRLANTAFWGLCYMTAFTWGFFSESEMVRIDNGHPRPVSGLLHYPTVAIVGFLPHMVIILGILVCGLIYVVALLLTAVSLGTNSSLRRPTSLKERISIAHDNLQAAIQLKRVTIRYYEDFYTALLRIGFTALTAASEAVFLNEGRAVEMRRFTWLEEDRLDELDVTRPTRSPGEAHFQIVEEYGIPGSSFETQDGGWKSGYEKERKPEDKESNQQNKNSFTYPNPSTDNVGVLQRTKRFYMLFIFMRGILFTIAGWFAFGMGALLDHIGITARPNWLRRVIGISLKQVSNDTERARTLRENRKFDEWAENGGIISHGRRADVDIEQEMRARVAVENPENASEVLDQKMYDWWKSGGWYGTIDESGDYAPPVPSIEQDEDATSVITTTTATTTREDEWESEPEGTRTPSQRHLSPSWSFSALRQRRSVTPSPEAPILDNATLARLLNPPDQSSRDEARILSSHLAMNNGIMTRSRYRQAFQQDRAKVLLAGRTPLPLNVQADSSTQQASTQGRRPLTGDEEAQVLEKLLITRRVQKQRAQHHVSSSHSPAFADATSAAAAAGAGWGNEGPLCVVCQAEPRTIIAWPCRCLTVCEECRVNLAMNNFGNCVTCRRGVGGFVRLYVP